MTIKFDYIRAFYNSIGEFEDLKKTAAYTDTQRGKSTCRMIRKANDLANPIASILEIGPASGFITEYVNSELQSMKSTAFDVMDLSHSYLDTLRSKNYRIRNFIEWDIHDDRTSEKYGNAYQMILFQEVLEHLVSPYQALCNISKMLMPGGYLYISLPNAYYWRYQMKMIFKKSKLIRNKKILDSHISELAPLGVLRLASMAGFDLTSIDFYASKLPCFTTLGSTQVGILLEKSCPPERRWGELTTDVVNHWKRATNK